MKRASVLDVALVLLLTAGAIGAVRRSRELAAVRRGEAAPVGPTTHVVASPSQGSVARRAGSWTPQRPVTRSGRLLAYLWASPATFVGLLVGVLTGGRPRWDDEHGCVVIEGARGGPARLLRAAGFTANAIGHVVVSTKAETPAALLAHEAGHVRQAERLGPLLLPLYVLWWARYGYRHHPLERGARASARRWRRSTPSARPRSRPPPVSTRMNRTHSSGMRVRAVIHELSSVIVTTVKRTPVYSPTEDSAR